MTTQTHPQFIISTGVRALSVALIAQAIGRFAASLVDELGQRKAMRELRALDDRMLADIGLRPGEIETAARYGRHGLGSPFQRI